MVFLDHKLPTAYNPKYVTCRKQADQTWKMFWIGTNNEIFPGERFKTPQEARMYLRVQIIKNRTL